jgi:hypothetical protein
MPKNMRIFEVSSGCLSCVWAWFETDDTEVLVDGAEEGTGESSVEPDDVDVMTGRGKGVRLDGRTELLSQERRRCRDLPSFSHGPGRGGEGVRFAGFVFLAVRR